MAEWWERMRKLSTGRLRRLFLLHKKTPLLATSAKSGTPCILKLLARDRCAGGRARGCVELIADGIAGQHQFHAAVLLTAFRSVIAGDRRSLSIAVRFD